MSDFEHITLIGGPHDGADMPWDGGDYVSFAEMPATKFHPYASERFKELFMLRHTYRRDPENRSHFIYIGG